MRILVNGMSAKSGGGRSVLLNFLRALASLDGEHAYIVVVPPGAGFDEVQSPRIEICEMPLTGSSWGLLLLGLIYLPLYAWRRGCDVIFNPSDLPMPTWLPQFFLFDWPYAAFPDSPAWRLSSARDRLIRRIKLFFFKLNLRFITVMGVQSAALLAIMRDLYRLDQLVITPNAVSIDHLHRPERKSLLPATRMRGFRLLCLSAYYSHKNIEILLDVASLLRDRGVDCSFVLTLDPAEHEAVPRLIARVRALGLEERIINVGRVPMPDIPALFADVDAMILPTLLESFSGTYVEAMFHEKPILTSNLVFATSVCEDAAEYFDPQDPAAMADAIERVIDDAGLRQRLVAAGRRRLAAFPSWHEVARSIEATLVRIGPGR